MVRLSMKPWTICVLFAELAKAIPAAESALTPGEVLDILEPRQNSCPTTAPVSCQSVDPKLPSNFCCRTGSICISLDSSSSALCCPTGSSCTVIQPIDCDVSLQDASQGRQEPVFTTRLTDSMPQCGTNKCCPFGYSCGKGTDGSAICQVIADKAVTQQPSSSTPSASMSTSASNPATSSTVSTSGAVSAPSSVSSVSPASASSIDSTKPHTSQSGNPFPPLVFLAGLFPGMLVGALGVLAWVIITGRHKKSDGTASAASSIYKRKPYISGPVPINPQNTRTEFLRRGDGTTRSGISLFTNKQTKRRQSAGTPGLPFDNWKMPTPPVPNNIPEHPMGQQIPAGPGPKRMVDTAGYSSATRHPKTPERQIYGEQAEPGTETIHVYSPPQGMDIPSATVAPLRGLNSRDRSRSSGVGSPFVTPNRALEARAPVPQTQASGYPYESTYETLTPARYEAGPVQKRPRPENAGQESRPETTFTAMLQAINFPDPMSRQVPKMPNLPSQYR